MANLSITQAWNETTAFLKREAGLVVPVALLLFALPGATLQLAMPVFEPGTVPDFGTWLLLLPIVMVASVIGNVAVTYLALRPGVSVGEALQHGLRRFIFLLAASLLVGLAFGLVAVLLVFVALGGGLLTGSTDPAAVAGPMLLVMLALAVIGLFFWVRLMLMAPVATMENAGPIAIIRRSWQLTAGHFWKLLGFVVLLLIAGGVIMVVVSALIGIVIFAAAGPPEPGSTSGVVFGIFSALLQAVFTTIFIVMIARIYGQLAGGTPEEVFA